MPWAAWHPDRFRRFPRFGPPQTGTGKGNAQSRNPALIAVRLIGSSSFFMAVILLALSPRRLIAFLPLPPPPPRPPPPIFGMPPPPPMLRPPPIDCPPRFDWALASRPRVTSPIGEGFFGRTSGLAPGFGLLMGSVEVAGAWPRVAAARIRQLIALGAGLAYIRAASHVRQFVACALARLVVANRPS